MPEISTGAIDTFYIGKQHMSEQFNYQAEALQTKSDKFYGDQVAFGALFGSSMRAISALRELDKVKKALFYGKIVDGVELGDSLSSCESLPLMLNPLDKSQATDIIHSIIGKATEAGELLELLLSSFDKNEFDVVNFNEEIGDGQWYDAIGLAAVNSTIADSQRVNIAKLRARFPNKFTEYDANNRKLDIEREILEDK